MITRLLIDHEKRSLSCFSVFGYLILKTSWLHFCIFRMRHSYGRYFGQIFFIMNVGSKMDQFWHVQKTNIVKTFNQESISGKYKVLGSFVQRSTMNKCFQNINCPSVSYNFVCKKVGRVGYTGRLLVAVGVNVLEMFNTDVDQRVRDLSFSGIPSAWSMHQYT